MCTCVWVRRSHKQAARSIELSGQEEGRETWRQEIPVHSSDVKIKSIVPHFASFASLQADRTVVFETAHGSGTDREAQKRRLTQRRLQIKATHCKFSWADRECSLGRGSKGSSGQQEAMRQCKTWVQYWRKTHQTDISDSSEGRIKRSVKSGYFSWGQSRYCSYCSQVFTVTRRSSSHRWSNQSDH